MSQIKTRYTCEECFSTRSIQLDEGNLDKITYEPKNASNGLFIYSDVHRCENGILGINNLHIDKNHDVRSFEYLRLPREKNKRKVMAGLPSPKKPTQDLTKYRITTIQSNVEFKLLIKDVDLGVHLTVGNVQEGSPSIFSIQSKRSGITLDYFKSEIQATDKLRSWFQTMIDLLEILPPTKIGLFIDSLRYISTLVNLPPVKFHTEMLKTILVSHEVRFILNDPSLDFVEELSTKEDLYDPDIIMRMLVLIEELTKSPNSSLQDFTCLSKWEISEIIYLFLLLEQDGYVTIQRPPEIEY